MDKGLGNAAEFFAGMGLIRRALETPSDGQRFRVVYANDLSPSKHRVYDALFPVDCDAASHVYDERDIASVRADEIPDCQLWTASFPCTDLSLAGSRRGIRAGQSGAVWAMLGLLRDKPIDSRPRWLLFENVTGLLSSHDGEDFTSLVSAINKLGFGVDVMRIDAVHFTPQSRPRLFIIATQLDDAHAPALVDPFALTLCDTRPAAVLSAMQSAPHLLWHARQTPPLPTRTISLEDIIEELPDDSPKWWSPDRTDYFTRQIHPNHVAKVHELRIGATLRHVTAFRRVRTIKDIKRSLAEIRFDGVAGCLRTPKGGSAKQIVIQLGGGSLRVRHMTAVECMRLQGVDDAPPMNMSENELLFALGDAVCVPAARWALDQLEAPSTIVAPAEHPSRSAPSPSISIAVS
jgi:DNA (cytosine-5)-methyltransferase 1